MKKEILIFSLVALLLLLLQGCNDDNIPEEGVNDDPPGTITAVLLNGTPGLPNAIYIDNAWDPIIIKDSLLTSFYGIWRFADIGEINNLNDIKAVPFDKLGVHRKVEPGHGYVASSDWLTDQRDRSGTTYVRMHVLSWLYNKGGDIIGANIKYQYPFCPKPEVDEISLSMDEISISHDTLFWHVFHTIAVKPASSWIATSSQKWCSFLGSDLLGGFTIAISNFKSEGVRYELLPGDEATITVSMEGLPDKELKVKIK